MTTRKSKIPKFIAIAALCSALCISLTSAAHAVEGIGNDAFDDPAFYDCVAHAYADQTGTEYRSGMTLTDAQLGQITEVICDEEGVDSTNGVEKLTALSSLFLYGNGLSAVDVSKNTALTDLRLNANNLSAIDISKNTALTWLEIAWNNLSSIDVSKNTKLTYLELSHNNLSSIDLSKNTALTYLSIMDNNLSIIDLSKNTALNDLLLSENNLSTIDVSKNTALTALYLSGNNLSSIDVSNNINLSQLNVRNNYIKEVDISNNPLLTTGFLFDPQKEDSTSAPSEESKWSSVGSDIVAKIESTYAEVPTNLNESRPLLSVSIYTIFAGIIGFAVDLLLIISRWKTFEKAGQKGWKSLIPFYKEFVVVDIAGLKPLYAVLYTVLPLVFVVASVITPADNKSIMAYIGLPIIFALFFLSFKIYVSFAHKFGQSSSFGDGLVLFPYIFFPILAFSKKIVYMDTQINDNPELNNLTFQQPNNESQWQSYQQPQDNDHQMHI